MKCSIFLFFIFISISSSAKDLQCSARGTDVYYLNGVLTSDLNNKIDTNAIKELFKARENRLDSGPLIAERSPVAFIGIHNPSFGFINDTAELFAQAYYIKTGSDSNAKAIYNAIKNTPEAIEQDKAKYDPDGYFSMLNSFGLGNIINRKTLMKVVKESENIALKKSLASLDVLLRENSIVRHNVSVSIANSQYKKRKILFVAHSQGNALLQAGIKERTLRLVQEDTEYMEKYMGVFHVASPITPLSAPFKSKNIRTMQDQIIWSVSLLNGLPSPVAEVTHEVTSETVLDNSGHFFGDTYISPAVYARPINTLSISTKMSDIFVSTLSDLAMELEDNCELPNIHISSSELTPISNLPNTFHVKGYASMARAISIAASDSNDTDNAKSTQFSWEYLEFVPENHLIGNEFVSAISSPVGNDVNNDLSLSLPFNDKSYSVTITATNKFGKSSSKKFTFYYTENRAPVITNASAVCYSSNGNPSTTFKGTYYIEDDGSSNGRKEEIYRTSTLPGGSGGFSQESDAQGLLSEKYEWTNPCQNIFSVGGFSYRCESGRAMIEVTVGSNAGTSVYFFKYHPNNSITYLSYSGGEELGDGLRRYTAALDFFTDNEVQDWNVVVTDVWSGQEKRLGPVSVAKCQ